MIFTLMLFVFGFGLIFLFGYLLSKTLLPKSDIMEQISLGFVTGTGVFTFLWFILNWIFNIPYNLQSGFSILIILCLLAFAMNKYLLRRIDGNISLLQTFNWKKLTTLEKIVLIFISFLCISALIQTIYWPIKNWDSLVMYDFRAKLFAQTGNMTEAINRGYFFGYPLLTSLMHTWVYLLGVNNPSFYYGLLYLFLITTFYFNVKKLGLKRPLALIVTAILAVSPRIYDHTQWAYTNLPYSIYIVLGSIYLYWGIKKKELGSFLASALLIGLSTWTRSTEPFWLSILIIAVIFSILNKKCFWPVVYSMVLFAIMLPWKLFGSQYNVDGVNVVSHVTSTSVAVVNSLQLNILKPSLDFFIANVVISYWQYFVLFVVIVTLKILNKSTQWVIVLVIVCVLGFTFAGILLFVHYQPYWQDIPDSLARMTMFVPIMITFLLVELLSETKRKLK